MLIDDAGRRARLGVRHRLAVEHRAADPVAVTEALVGLHATDPTSVYLSVRARLERAATAADEVDPLRAVQDALYVDRSLVRVLGMRRTLWVVRTELVPILLSGASRQVAVTQRARLVKQLAGVPEVGEDPERWLDDLQDEVFAALERRGEAVGSTLSSDVPRLRTQVDYAEGKAYGGPASITPQVLNLMSMEGRIVRGRPRGSWVSRQYAWAPLSEWLPGSNGTVSGSDRSEPVDRVDGAGGVEEPDPETARIEIIRRWLWAFGPATEADLKWWTGWTLGQVRAAMAKLDTVPVELESGTGSVLASDVDQAPAPEPWVALLPALDPTAMGWRERDWYLPAEYRPQLFDRNGNVGPTVWVDGRVVGGWGHHRDSGDVVHRLFEDIGAEATARVEAEAGALTTWLGDTRVTPSFRTPLERELAGPT